MVVPILLERNFVTLWQNVEIDSEELQGRVCQTMTKPTQIILTLDSPTPCA